MVMRSCVKAIEDEGGDPDNIEITLSADTPTRKQSKSKGRPSRSETNSFTSPCVSFSKVDWKALSQERRPTWMLTPSWKRNPSLRYGSGIVATYWVH